MKKLLTILVLTLAVMSQFIIWAPAAQAVPLSCQDSPNNPDCIMELIFQWAFSEWNEHNEGNGINGVGIF